MNRPLLILFGVLLAVSALAANYTPSEPDDVGADPAGSAAAVQSNLDSHTSATTGAHGGIVSSGDSRLTDARTPTTHGNEKHSATYITAADAVTPATLANYTGAYLRKNGATAADQIYVSDGIGSWIARAWSWIVAKLGLGTAAYTASTDYAQHAAFASVSSASYAHRQSTSNPHSVTAAQVGSPTLAAFGNVTGLWRKSGNSRYYTGGNVGIGKNNPSATYTLDVTGDVRFVGIASVTSSLYVPQWNDYSIGAADSFIKQTGKSIQFSTSNTDRVRIFDAGMGIGLSALGTSAVKTLGIGDGTAPVTSVSGAQIWSSSITGVNIMTSGNTATTQIGAAKAAFPGRAIFGSASSAKLAQSSTATAIFGTSANNTTFEADGTLTMNGTATVWDDLRIEPVARGGAASPTFGTSVMSGTYPLYNYQFLNTDTGKYLYFNFQMPHGWKEGSTIYPHVHYLMRGANTGVVSFTLACSIATPGTGIFAITPTALTLSYDVTADGTRQHFMASNGTGYTMTNMGVSTIGSCRIERDADANAGDLELLYIDIHYEMDTIGSRTSTAK